MSLTLSLTQGVSRQIAGASLRQFPAFDHAGEVVECGKLVLRGVLTERHCHNGREDFRSAVVEELHVGAHHVQRAEFPGL